MFFKILFVLVFVTICSGSPPVPHTKSNQAIYSQSFVREDVPMSYRYSAVHYYTPKERETSNEVNPIQNFNKQAVKSDNIKPIQFAPQDPNFRKHLYPAVPVLYTSVVAKPAYGYEKYGLTDNSADSVLNQYHLEPKAVPFDATKVKPSTYKPHMNHDIKVFYSPPIQSNNYWNLNTQMMKTNVEKDAKIHHANPFNQHEQQIKYIPPSTTKTPKLPHVLNLDVRTLPRHHTPQITIPGEVIRPFQPIPRINTAHYKYSGHVAPEKLLGKQITLLDHHMHQNKSKMH